MHAESAHSIILGRPFLNTADAHIGVREGKLTFNVGGEEISFNVFDAVKRPSLEPPEVFSLDIIDHLAQEHFSDMLFKDPLEKSLVQSITAEIDSIVSYLDSEGHRLPWGRHEPKSLWEPLPKAKPSHESPPDVDLKPLPPNLKYAFLGEHETHPVIVNANLTHS